MLKNTFCHMPGIGDKSEQKLWADGLTSWDAVNEQTLSKLTPKRRDLVLQQVAESKYELLEGNAEYFDERLPARHAWRMFPEFEDSIVYLDIETTGLSYDSAHITTIAAYDGKKIYHFVRGENLLSFPEFIANYKVLVTYNGKTFDVPFLQNVFRMDMPHAHIDLRYILASLGISGGLKDCEKRLGFDRKDLADIDGYFAVVLWNDYVRTRKRESLETLLAYNIADVVNLYAIMPMAYNMKLQDTPFHQTHALPLVSPPEIPFTADRATIERLKYSY
jgi:uncharacterized protein YprB with RNaseH-like and TPR domain